MTRTLILWLPPHPADSGAPPPRPWLYVDDGVVVDSGQDDGWADLIASPADRDTPADTFVAIAPAGDVPVRWHHFPDAAPAQAAAAARIEALRECLGDAAALHVVAGVPAQAGQAVPVAVTTHAAMRGWMDWLAGHGLVPAAILPAAATVPPPDDASIWSVEVGDETLLRTADRAFASDPAIDPLITGAMPVMPLPAERMREALLLSLLAPPLDLLSGAWKPKRSWGIDTATLRRLARLMVALAAVSLLIPAVYAVRLAIDIRRADAAALAGARSAGVEADTVAAAESELDRRLAAAGGGPLAFSVPASALYDAVRDVPGVSVRTLSHRTDGTLTATLAAPRADDINRALLRLQARGYRITAQAMAGTDGQQLAIITIRAVP